MSDEKVRPFLSRPAVIDWLQWNDFNLKMNEPDYPQMTLSLIAEYKSAYDKLMTEARALRDALSLAANNVTWYEKGTGGTDVIYTYGHHVEKCQNALANFDKKYPQANEKE